MFLAAGATCVARRAQAADACPTDVHPPAKQAPGTIFVPCTNTPPVIDGYLDEGIWDKAAVITDFKQVDPVEGAEPTERTEVRIMYSPDALYFYLRAYEKDPSKITAKLRENDANLSPDDYFFIILDTFGHGRNAYAFAVNAQGVRRDILFENNRNLFGNWNTIWYAKAHIDDKGWVAEVAIPTKSLAFDKSPRDWGLNITRRIQHSNEEDRWTNVRRDLGNVNVSHIGKMQGLVGLKQGMGLDVKVSGSAGYVDDNLAGTNGSTFDPSLDVFYRFTPSVTGALTVNTDFAEAAVDSRQVNLSRFDIFYPETRAFFLQDVGTFEFADLDNNDINGRPFFTRNIGLTANGIVPILAGGKVTGHVDQTNFGLLSVQTDKVDEFGLRSQNLSVARASVNVLDQSQIGAIVTHGDPTGATDNTTYGMDFRYLDNSFHGKAQTLSGNAWFLRADTGGVHGGENAFGGVIGLSSDLFETALRFKDIGRNYHPALGFTNRVDIREYKSFTRLRWRPSSGFLRYIDWREFGGLTTDHDNRLETLKFNSEIRVNTVEDDQVGLEIRYTRDRLDTDFALLGDLIIPAGDYQFVRPRLTINTNGSRALSTFISIEAGDYYGGTNFTFSTNIDFKPSPLFYIGFRYDHSYIKLPSGRTTVRVVGFNFNVNFTPDLQWANSVQYDNVSKNASINSRLHWIVKPGSEFYIVINQDSLIRNWDIHSQRSEAVIKLGHTFRM